MDCIQVFINVVISILRSHVNHAYYLTDLLFVSRVRTGKTLAQAGKAMFAFFAIVDVVLGYGSCCARCLCMWLFHTAD